MKIDLVGTELRTRPFDRIADQVDASGFQQGERWLHCYVKDEVWHGAGDETKLAVILKTFLDWASHRGVSHEGGDAFVNDGQSHQSPHQSSVTPVP